MKFLFILLTFSSSVFAAPPSFALIESEEDIKRVSAGAENTFIRFQKRFDVYVGGTYNKDKNAAYPIVALKYGKYTLEYAHQDWFDAPDNHYWKFKMKKFLYQDRLNLEV